MVATHGDGWTLAPALVQLMAEIDVKYPKRPTDFDGSIGDDAHAARKSEHNPNRDPKDDVPNGMVTAVDVTKKTPSMIDDLRRKLVKDGRIWYVIHNGTIWSRTHNFVARPYDGSNPHEHHLHVSLMQRAALCNDARSWGIAATPATETRPAVPAAKVPPKPPWPPTLQRGDRNALIITLQRFLGIDPPGAVFGPRTELAVRRYQQAHGLVVDGVVGPKTWTEIRKALKLPEQP